MADAVHQSQDAADRLAGWAVGALLLALVAPVVVTTTVAGWVWQRARWPLWTLLAAATATTAAVALTGAGSGYLDAYHAVWIAASSPAPMPAWSELVLAVAPTAAAAGLVLALPVVAVQRYRDVDWQEEGGQQDHGPGLVVRVRRWWTRRYLAGHTCTRPSLSVAVHRLLPPRPAPQHVDQHQEATHARAA